MRHYLVQVDVIKSGKRIASVGGQYKSKNKNEAVAQALKVAKQYFPQADKYIPL